MLRIQWLKLTSRFPPLPGGVLDEQTAWLRKVQVLLGEQALAQTTPLEARARFDDTMRGFEAGGGLFEKVYEVRDLAIPGPAGEIPARLYLPDAQPSHPLLIYFHGGGWVIGSLLTADIVARFFCRRGGLAVLSVDYRLAPEHPFPAAVEDCLSSVRWAAENASSLAGDPQRLLVGGDSAGANLSAVIALLARDGGPRLAGQVLLCSATDCVSLDTGSYQTFGDGTYSLPKADMDWFIDQYAPPPIDRRDPRISPLLAADLSGLPPALVATAEFDVLRDEGEAYAQRLQEAGVPVTLLRGNGMIHDFFYLVGLIQRATQYFDEVVAEVRKMAGA